MATALIKVCAAHMLALLLLPSLCAAATPEKDAPRTAYTPSQYLKNYALSSCLSYGLAAKESKVEAGDASRGYLELGSFDLAAYEEAAALAHTFLAKEYLSIGGGKLTVMKCIDLFHSKELDQLAKKYDRERNARLKNAKHH
jgi:hypothetical protein